MVTPEASLLTAGLGWPKLAFRQNCERRWAVGVWYVTDRVAAVGMDLDDPNVVNFALVAFHVVFIASIVAYFSFGRSKTTKLD